MPTVWATSLALLLVLTLGGCASRPPGGAGFAAGEPADAVRMTVVETAQQMIGRPYRIGGDGPRGFDCSGLTRYAYGRAGIALPRTSAAQFSTARPIARSDVRPGDLLFFNINGQRASHVGIYVGEGRFIHAPSTGKRVSVESLDNPYWRRRIIGAGHYF
ncbi:MAG: C40 family peptidase [Thiohalobacteraceae bacterium]